MKRKYNDIDLMTFHDGEEFQDGGIHAELLNDEGSAEKLQAMQEIGDFLRTYGELSADDVESKFSNMWESIDAQISAPTHLREVEAFQDSTENVDKGLWHSIKEFFSIHRGHFATGAMVGAAAVILTLSFSGSENKEASPINGQAQRPIAVPIMPASIRHVDVPSGTPNIIKLPGETGEDSTTLIWVEHDPEQVDEI